MSNYRDTVREMMRELKANKAGASTPAPVETIEADVPDEEHLLDDILDLEEGGPVAEPIVNEEEADRLLASSPIPEPEENCQENNVAQVENANSCEANSVQNVESSEDSKDSKNASEEQIEEDSKDVSDVAQVDTESKDDAIANDEEKEEEQPVKDQEKESTEEEVEDKEEESDDDEVKCIDESSQEVQTIEDDDEDSKPSVKSSEATSEKESENQTQSDEKQKYSGITRPKRPSKKKATEVVDLSSDEEESSEEEEESSEDDEVGDPDRDPGEGASKDIPNAYLQPFLFGWKREVVFRRTKNVTECDIYYLPPLESRYRTREAKRKRRSKADQERYFEDFPDDNLSIANFNYVRKPLGLENAAYEIVRRAGLESSMKSSDQAEKKEDPYRKTNAKKSLKEVEESAGLLESNDEDDEEVRLICGFDPEVPVSLQAFHHVAGMNKQHDTRKRHRDPETCCTPPLAEDTLWTNLNDEEVQVGSTGPWQP